VTGHKKKIMVFLSAVALVSGGLLATATPRTGSDRPSAGLAQSVAQSPELKNPAFKPLSAFATDPNFSGKSAESIGSGELFFKMMLSVMLVVALGAAAIYTSKKLVPKIANLPGKQIRILETVHLGPRRAVHLVEVVDRDSTGQKQRMGPDPASREPNIRLLIGSTNENITMLANLTDTLAELAAQQINESVRV